MIDDRVAQAVELAREATTAEEDDTVWRILEEVAADGPASLRAGIGLLGRPDPVARSVGCDLLGCASDRHEEVRTDAASALLALAPAETDVDVTWSLACALGRTADERAIPALVPLAGHPDADVRRQVAQALPPVAGGDFDGAEIGALIRLTGDEDADVRNWATFGLGNQLAVDSPAVREALWARVHDESRDVHDEAVFGLARRRAPGATPLLAALLAAEEGVFTWGLEAAACLRDPALLPHLAGYDPTAPMVAAALRECDPAARAERDRFAAALFDTLHDRPHTAEFALFSSRFEPGLTLTTTLDGRTGWWSVDALIEGAGGDPARAADLVTDGFGDERRVPEAGFVQAGGVVG